MSEITHSLQSRSVLLKLLSMNLYDLEKNCTLDELISFKREYKRALDTVDQMLRTYFPKMNNNDRNGFIFSFFPFLFGLYPYANVTEKQRDAMIAAGAHFQVKRVYDFAYQTILIMLRGVTPGDNKELMIIPNAVHTDLYDNMEKIPFDKIEAFFKTNLK